MRLSRYLVGRPPLRGLTVAAPAQLAYRLSRVKEVAVVLISTSELAAIQSIAHSGMISSMTVWKRSIVAVGDDSKANTFTQGATVEAWIWEMTPDSTTISPISGVMGVSELFWVRVPLGTDVESGDKLVQGSAEYIVENTNNESTYQAWLVCNCRKLT